MGFPKPITHTVGRAPLPSMASQTPSWEAAHGSAEDAFLMAQVRHKLGQRQDTPSWFLDPMMGVTAAGALSASHG